MPRGADPAGKRFPAVVSVQVDEQQYRRIWALARDRGLTPAALLRTLALAEAKGREGRDELGITPDGGPS